MDRIELEKRLTRHITVLEEVLAESHLQRRGLLAASHNENSAGLSDELAFWCGGCGQRLVFPAKGSDRCSECRENA